MGLLLGLQQRTWHFLQNTLEMFWWLSFQRRKSVLGLQFFCLIAWSLNCLPSQETPASISGSDADLSNPTAFQQPPCAAHPRSKTYRIGFGVKYFHGVRRGLGLNQKVLTRSMNFLIYVRLPNSIYAVFFSTYITRIKCINKKGMSWAYSSVGRGLTLHDQTLGSIQRCRSPRWCHKSAVPAPGRWTQKDQKFKVILGFTVNSRLACCTWESGSKTENEWMNEWHSKRMQSLCCSKPGHLRTGEVAPWLGAMLLFHGTWVWFPAPAHQLTTICASNSRRFDALFWPMRIAGMLLNKQTKTQTHKPK